MTAREQQIALALAANAVFGFYPQQSHPDDYYAREYDALMAWAHPSRVHALEPSWQYHGVRRWEP